MKTSGLKTVGGLIYEKKRSMNTNENNTYFFMYIDLFPFVTVKCSTLVEPGMTTLTLIQVQY